MMGYLNLKVSNKPMVPHHMRDNRIDSCVSN